MKIDKIWEPDGVFTYGHVYFDLGRGKPWFMVQMDLADWRIGFCYSRPGQFWVINLLCLSIDIGRASHE